ncbi:tetratricopeptide repeat protein [Komagataeibacter sp. FNDCR2]|uniref:tetratricopeptide repeat protein n=1 Tax=Komagataeibacter sp. FNDCR2 TaxID=2878682 RepID=UPI001E465FBC|nr:sel1 repeat family protein [Komagataeibacter sp. FNDCR2]MCE2574175.1 sel1 repeat family protein [Komagataeibacter sp. FNDCR2]
MKLPFSFVLLATLACTTIIASDARAGISRIAEEYIDPWMVYGGSDNGVRSCTVVAKVAEGAGFAVQASDDNKVAILLINAAYKTSTLDHANVTVDMKFDDTPSLRYASAVSANAGTVSHVVDAKDLPGLVRSLSDARVLTLTISAPVSQTWKVDLTKAYFAMKAMKRDCVLSQHLDNLPAPFTQDDTYLNEPDHQKPKAAADALPAVPAPAPSQPTPPPPVPGMEGVPQTDARTMYEIGRSYEQGMNVMQDYAAAKEWYTKAAAAGDADAMDRLGWFYYHGIGGTARDDSLASKYFLQAARTGNAAALIELANFYDSDNLFIVGGPKGKEIAEELYIQAANTGSSDAMVAAGDWYASNPLYIENPSAKSLRMYLKATDVGNVVGMQKAGWDYVMRIGMPREEANPAKGIELLKKAADGNNIEAMRDLSLVYSGTNVPDGTAPIDKAQSQYWWTLFLKTRARQNAH